MGQIGLGDLQALFCKYMVRGGYIPNLTLISSSSSTVSYPGSYTSLSLKTE